jgi:hypothetical protein
LTVPVDKLVEARGGAWEDLPADSFQEEDASRPENSGSNQLVKRTN